MVNKDYLKKLNVLYVEDELEAANKLSKFLNRIFNEIYYSPNGKEALEIFENKKIDLVISDINMPVMDGLELSEKVREINSSIPIILTTARTETSCLTRAIELNVDSYLLKPIELDKLIDKIYSVAEKIEAQETKKLLYQYKYAIDESSIVMKFDIEGKITFVNEMYEEISGYKLIDVKDKFFNFNSLFDEPASTFSQLWEALKTNNIWKGKISSRTDENLKYVLSTTIVPIKDYNNNIVEYISISSDITEEENLNIMLEDKLEEYKGKLSSKTHLLSEYRRCFDISSISISLDTQFNIISVNSKFVNVIKKDIDEVYKKSLVDIVGENAFQNIFDIVSEEKIKQIAIEIPIENRSSAFIDFTFSPVYNEKGELIEYIGVGNDITELIELQHEIEMTQKDLVLTLGSIGESKSKETANHVNRVALYSYILAKGYGLSEDEANTLKIASTMHDIGKIGIPDSILNKPAKLTCEEYEIMKTHAVIGYNMFKKSKRKILKSSSIVAHEHHEKWDGTGYPRGLKGEDIHIFGRITAIADVFDALNSKRCYKEKWEIEDIKNYFKEKSGEDFDPKLVDVLFNNIDKFLEINDEYCDSTRENHENY